MCIKFVKFLILISTLISFNSYEQSCKYSKVITLKNNQIITSSTDYDCIKEPEIIYREIEKPIYIYEETTPIIFEKTRYINQINGEYKPSIFMNVVKGLMNVILLNGIYPNHNNRVSCYTNWQNGQKNCY